MALHADTVWEFQNVGSNNNGGGFYDRVPATSVDYSQQAAAQLTLADLATDGAGTGLSSVTGGFTAAMAGNVVNITAGTGFTPGWYEIVTYTDTNNVVIDRSAGASATAGAGYVGGARAVFTDAFGEQLGVSRRIWQKGTMTLTENIDIAKDGTAALPFIWEGYDVTRGDAPKDGAQPLIICAAYTFSFDNYWQFYNLQATTTASTGWRADINGCWTECKVQNTSITASRYALNPGSARACVIRCDVASDLGYAVFSSASSGRISDSYLHDSAYGAYLNSSSIAVTGNIIDTISDSGVYLAPSGDHAWIEHNTIYNSLRGIRNQNADAPKIFNNDINTCTTGIQNLSSLGEQIDYNNYHSNGTDITGATKGDNATANDPGYVNRSGGNFANTLPADAMPKGSFPGGLTANYTRQGAAQPDSAGGGGGETSYVSIT